MSDLELLREVGDLVVVPPFDDLRGTARRRDRRRAVVSVVAAAAAVAAIGVAVRPLALDEGAPAPSGPAQPPPRSDIRPLTWAEGSTIHYGEVSVAAPGPVRELDLTDDGVAFRTADGSLWFADGTSAAAQIGQLGTPVEPSGDLERWIPLGNRFTPLESSTGWVVSGNSGSLVAWLDFSAGSAPVAVVYDTRARETVSSTPVTDRGDWVGPDLVTEDALYLYRDPDPFADDEVPQARLDLASGEVSAVSPEDFLATAQERPARSLLVSHAENGFRVHDVVEGPGQQLGVSRGRVVPAGMQPLEVRDALSDTPLDLRAPDGAVDANPVWLTQWLDDSTVVLSVPDGGRTELWRCPVPAGTCESAATVPRSAVLPDVWFR